MTETTDIPPITRDLFLSYRANRTGTLHAVYRGEVRVGYVARGQRERDWTWNLYLLRPHGGGYMGRAESLEVAKQECATALLEWATHADLMVLP